MVESETRSETICAKREKDLNGQNFAVQLGGNFANSAAAFLLP